MHLNLLGASLLVQAEQWASVFSAYAAAVDAFKEESFDENRLAYVRDVNNRISAAESADEIQQETQKLRETLEDSSVEELRDLWPAK